MHGGKQKPTETVHRLQSSYSQVFVALKQECAEIVNKLLRVQQDFTFNEKGGNEGDRDYEEWNPGMN